MARRRYYTREDLTALAVQRSTPAQQEKLKQYLSAGWYVTKVDGFQGCDCVVCIQLQQTVAVISPDGVVTRAARDRQSVSYKLPRTRTA